MHPLNPYLDSKPDFALLASRYPDFAPYVTVKDDGYASIDFQDPAALRGLTSALLKEDWGLDVQLREDRLCPTIANRLDYLLHILDLEPYFDSTTNASPEKTLLKNANSRIRVLDIGTGHVAVYPLLLRALRPNALICATEIDLTSLSHAQAVLAQNRIPNESIALIRAYPECPTLFPLDGRTFDVVVCNPPFFSSENEMTQGQDLKADGAHAAPTASSHELITPGGEVAFVSIMMRESREVPNGAKWYTSLIGKFASLQPLVETLRNQKVENYFIKIIRPARTTRWIIGWSYTSTRLPDNLTRPSDFFSKTTFARLLPPPNHLVHTPSHPPLAVYQLRDGVMAVLKDVHIETQEVMNVGSSEISSVIISPKQNTWSRAARRQAARVETDVTPQHGSNDQDQSRQSALQDDQGRPNKRDQDGPEEDVEPLMVLRLSFIPPIPPCDTNSTSDPQSEHINIKTEGDWRGATLTLDFVMGKERALVDAFWKFVLTKAGLLGGGSQQGGDQVKKGRDDHVDSGGRNARSARGARMERT